MSESECPECGSVLRYWPSEVKTEMLPGHASYRSEHRCRYMIT